MSKRFFIISAAVLLFLPISAQAAEQKIRGPINVTSETLTADNKSRTALFEGKVVAKTADMTIYSDKMLVFYNEGGGDVTEIDATGNVRLVRGSRVITSQQAVYYAAEDKVVFTVEPRAMDGENVVTGAKMTYFITEDRSVVEKSKVFLKSKGK